MVSPELLDEAEFLVLSLLRRALRVGAECFLPVVKGSEDVITLRCYQGGNPCVVDIWRAENQPIRFRVGDWSGASRLVAFVRVCDFLRLPVSAFERQQAEKEG